MPRNMDLLLTSVAPIIWGSTYFVTTEYLPSGYPLTVAMLRALPIGLLLLLVVRELPSGKWWIKTTILGAFNFSMFWWMIFISAYRLPGGVAATVGAIQPLIVIFLSYLLLGTVIHRLAIVSAILGVAGIGVLVIAPEASLDPIGLMAAIGSAISMSLGVVLTRRWQPPVSLITFTSWQLVAGGVLLLPAAMWFEPPLPELTNVNMLGLLNLGLIGTGLTYMLWFRGLSRVEPSVVSMLGFLSPITAVIIGWLFLNQGLSLIQLGAVSVILLSLWLNQINRV